MNITKINSNIVNVINQYIQKRIGLSAFNSWFSDTIITLNDQVSITVQSQFVKDWIDNHYADVLFDACNTVCSMPYCIEVKTSNEANRSQIKGELLDISMPLDQRMTFDTFVVGQSNSIAFEAARRVSNEAQSFSPLFLYGASGYGKTHLLQSIAFSARSTHKVICYVSAEQYMMMFVRALKAQDIVAFKNTFRAIDMLIVDDFQFMSGKDSTQSEFFHVFTHLISQGKQIVISADKSPRELIDIEDRLRSRLNGGLSIQIHAAPYELRLGILREKVRLSQRQIDLSILELIADKIVTSVRELEGALIRMWAQVDFFDSELTLKTAQSIISDMTSSATNILMCDIIRIVLEFYNITEHDLLSTSRMQRVVIARQVAMMLCRELTKKSLPEIAKTFRSRDHTNVLYSINKIREKAKLNANIAVEIEQIRARLVKQ